MFGIVWLKHCVCCCCLVQYFSTVQLVGVELMVWVSRPVCSAKVGIAQDVEVIHSVTRTKPPTPWQTQDGKIVSAWTHACQWLSMNMCLIRFVLNNRMHYQKGACLIMTAYCSALLEYSKSARINSEICCRSDDLDQKESIHYTYLKVSTLGTC